MDSNLNTAKVYAVIVGGTALALLVAADIVTSGLNPLATTFRDLAAVVAVIGFAAPRAGLYLLAILTGYQDLLKRLLILYGDVSMLDAANILAAAPILAATTAMGCFVGRLFSHQLLTRREIVILVIAVLFAAANMYFSLRGGVSMGAMAVAANTAAYIPLLFVIPLLFPDVDSLTAYFKVILVSYIPVAIYGIYQSLFGLSLFEIAYLKSGLSSTVTLLDDVRPRPFSTMSSPHAYGLTMVWTAVLAFSFYVHRELRGKIRLPRWFCLFMFVLYTAAVVLSLGRTGWFGYLFSIAATYLFVSKRKTLIAYGVSVVAITVIVTNADAVADFLGDVQTMLPVNSAVSQQAFRLGTFSDRLISFKNMFENPRLHTLFGDPDASMHGDTNTLVHDALGQMLFRFGLVGTSIAVAVTFYFLLIIHRTIWRIDIDADKQLSVTLAAMVFAYITTGVLSGSHLHVFPLNYFFWLFCAALLSLQHADQERDRAIRRGGGQRKKKPVHYQGEPLPHGT